jgi:OOP family OmpA-OmpF porin
MTEQQGEAYHGMLSQAQLNELRNLLVGLSNEELKRLQTLLRDPHEFAGEISPILPAAIRKMVERGQLSLDSVLPMIEEALHQGIQKNPQRLADILFPVMGPAIRKAVSEDLKRLIQTANAGLEQGFSPKRLGWRLQALFTGKSYTEILLAKTYIFHVSHVMLIHRQTGLLLHQEKADKAVDLEADMISSMLTAIRDFVSDSFNQMEHASLDQIQVGDMTILIEQGPFAIVAAVIKGMPPADYRVSLMEAIEAVHFNHALDLENFDGNVLVYENTGKFLKTCLVSYRKQGEGSKPWPLIIILIIILLAIGWFGFQRYSLNKRINRFTEQLDALPGYHINDIQRSGRFFVIRGFKDYEAPEYKQLESWKIHDTGRIQLRLDPIISLEPAMILYRAEKILQPLSSTSLDYQNGTLILKGTANKTWFEENLPAWTSIPGVNDIDTRELNVKSPPDLSWIIPAIERHQFAFDVNITTLDSVQQRQFDSLVAAAVLLTDYNAQYGKKMAIFVQVYTNRYGNIEANIRKATERVDAFVSKLKEAGLPDDLLEGRVLFTDEPSSSCGQVRTVTFNVFNSAEDR